MKLATLIALWGGLSFGSVAWAQSQPPVKIGVLTDKSSVYSVMSGNGSVEGARMAIEDFGGVALGKPIDMVSADHLNKPDVGLTIARQWFDTDGVSLIVDIPTSSVALSVSALAKTMNKLVIISTAAGEQLTEENCSPHTLAWSWDNYSLLKPLVDSFMDEGMTSWFFIGPDYAYSHTALDNLRALVEARHGKLVGEVFHPLGATDFSAFLLQAQASKAQVIATASGGSDVQNFVKQGVEFQVFPNQKLAMLTNVINDTRVIGLQAMQGTRSITPFYWNRDDATRAFAKRFFARTGFMPGETQAGVYSAVLNYLKAVEATQSVDADGITNYLRTHPIDDLFAQHAKLLANGRMIHDMYFVETKKPGESTGPWDLYKILKIIPGEKAFRPIAESKCPFLAAK